MPIPDAPEVEIDVAEFLPTAEDGKFTTGQDTANIWSDYMITSRLDKDYHRFMMGVTSPNGLLGAGKSPSVGFVQLTAPTVVWVVDWTALRTGEKPTVPDPLAVAANQWVLLDERLEPGMVALQPNGTSPMYRISGTYVYGALRPSDFLGDDAVFPVPPWVDAATLNREVPKAMFQAGLSTEPYSLRTF